MKISISQVLLGAALVTGSAYSVAATTVDDNGQVTVIGKSPSDAQIRDEVSKAIDEHSELRFDNIGVRSVNHEVYLSGLVDTNSEAANAAAIARSVPSVKDVHSALAVNGNG